MFLPADESYQSSNEMANEEKKSDEDDTTELRHGENHCL